MKLLANENFPAASVRYLRSVGYDVRSVGDDFGGISDKDVIELAQSERRLILTFDRDYGELIFKHQLQPDAGVIYLRLQTYESDEPGKIVERLLASGIETERSLVTYDGRFIRQRKY